MPDLRIIDYILGAVCLLLAIVSGLYWYQGTQFAITKARYAEFVANTKAVGVVADLQGKLTNLKHETLKKDSDHEIDLARNSIRFYADELRKRAESPRSSLLPAAPAGSPSPKRTDFDTPELTEAMGRYTDGMGQVRRRATELINEGAEAVAELDGAKQWSANLDKKETP